MYDFNKRLSYFGHIKTGLAGGMLAGMIVGFSETLSYLLTLADLKEIWLLPYSLILYGLFFGLVGGGLGIGGAIVKVVIKWSPKRRLGFMIYTLIVLFLSFFRISFYRYYQIALHERVPAISDYLILLAMTVIVMVFVGVILTLLFRIKFFRSLAGLGGMVAWFVGISLIAIVIAKAYEKNPEPLTTKSALASQIPGVNVILIIVDTLRYDHLSVNGSTRTKTPHFDKFASEAINYKWCIGQSSWTKPQIATILTGMYPASHRTMSKSDILPDAVTTVAEAFAQKGYYTIGIADNVNIGDAFNFQQGFDEFYFMKPDYYFLATESVYRLTLYSALRQFHDAIAGSKIWPWNYYQPAEAVTDKAISRLKDIKDKRFFMMVHYMDPHDPYFEHPYNGKGFPRAGDESPPDSMVGPYHRAYDQEVEYHDRMLGKLLDYLKENNMFDSTIIAITADHGEEFLEHGGWWHGFTLYDEGIHIPLMIKPLASTFEPHTDTTIVRSIDISPTLISLAGFKIPSTWQGVNLFTRQNEPNLIYSEEDIARNVIHSIRTREWKYIITNPDNPRGLQPQELYHISVDPGEKDNVVSKYPKIVKEMEKEIERMKLVAAGQAVEEQKTNIDEATKERLKALGYIK